MDSLLSFSGLASGIQWRDLVDQIGVLDSRPITLMQSRISAAQSRTTAWNDFSKLVETIRTSAAGLSGSALLANKVSIGGSSSLLASASATTDATPGTHTVRAFKLASAETIDSNVFSSRTDALNLAGEFRINGKRIEILATDSFDQVAAKINTANANGALGVTASILTTGSSAHRLVLSSTKTGEAGIDLADGATGVLRDFGFLDSNVAIKTATTNGAKSDILADSLTTVASLLGFTSPAAASTVTIGGVDVAIDLSTMSLTDIASAINAAATTAGRGVTASVIDDGTGKRLDIRGATSFTDSNRILESLGILEGGRSAVAQEIQSAVLESGAGVPATAGTLLTALWSGGAAANVQAGDTLTMTGTRGDGTSFTFDYTIGAGDTMQTLVNRLNDASDAFGAGTRTGTASVSVDGRLIVTDDTGGNSRLALNIVAHNEGGGSLDFSTFSTSIAGRNRIVTAGSDAELEIDGSYIKQARNTVTGVVPGLTLTLGSADPNAVSTITVSRDVDAAATAVKGLFDAYNALTDFVNLQLTPPPTGQAPPPLAGDSILRSMRISLRSALGGTLSTALTGGLARLSDIGIEIDKTGRYKVDDSKLRASLQNGAEGVKRLFGVYAETTGSGLTYVGSSDKTVAGTYGVDITQAPTWASITGAGFSGSYVDDGVPDIMQILDTGSNSTYSVSLTNGMTLSSIIDALNVEFATPLAHTAAATNTLYSDGIGTPADDTTLWSDVRLTGGVDPGVAADDVITIAGTKTDGGSFLTNLIVSAGGTLGELKAAVQNALGTDVDVTWESGVLTATAKTAGSKSFTLSITSDNAGGGTFDLGAISATQQGRGIAQISALDDNGQMRIAHKNAGAVAGFDVSFTPGGTDGTGSLGIAAGSWVGTDVVGTIGGFAATGSGTVLTGAAGSPVDGLLVGYDGSATGAIGDITFSRGLAKRLQISTDVMLGTGVGSIKGLIERINGSVLTLEDRIETVGARIARRREVLIRRFTKMEEVMALAQSQSAWLEAQIGQLDSMRKQSNR